MIGTFNRISKFLKRKLPLGSVNGIPVFVDYRWVAVFFLLAFAIGSNLHNSLVSGVVPRMAVGLFAAVLFFAGLFVHEYGHAVAARREGIRVLDIQMLPFGGIARLATEPKSTGAEIRVAIGGPLGSIFCALGFLGAATLSRGLGSTFLQPMFFALFLLNISVAVFNLFPGFPLDGGRVLRALLRKRGMPLSEATVLAAKIGQFIAFTLIFFGIAMIFVAWDLVSGIWSIVVGFFLLDAATAFVRGATRFDQMVVEMVMEPPVSISPDMTIMEVVDRILPFHRQTIFPISKDRDLFGFLELEDLRETLPREKWNETFVKDVMRPVREDLFVDSGESVKRAKELLAINGLGALGVIDEKGRLVGFLRQGRIRRRG
ncbi:MAG: site-2 protease family protein [Pyrinomonadaceae bacterium]